VENIQDLEIHKVKGLRIDYQVEPIERNRQPDLLEGTMSSLTKGWSIFSDVVGQGAKLAVSGATVLGNSLNENVIAPASTALRDPNLTNNIQSYISNIVKLV
jgi:ADP-ribosylation factor GTPase-activating protein 1